MKPMTQESLPIINIDRCTRCGKCVEICPEDALELTEQGPTFKQPIMCTYCTTCEDVCPENAIRTPFTVSWASATTQNIQ